MPTDPRFVSLLECEEALVAALLLHDDYEALKFFTDADPYFSHLAPVLRCVRKLHAIGEPFGTVFVLEALSDQLDDLEWKGLHGAAMLLDLLDRHVLDPQAWWGPKLAALCHSHAEERRRRERAQSAATQAYVTSPVVPVSGWSFVGD